MVFVNHTTKSNAHKTRVIRKYVFTQFMSCLDNVLFPNRKFTSYSIIHRCRLQYDSSAIKLTTQLQIDRDNDISCVLMVDAYNRECFSIRSVSQPSTMDAYGHYCDRYLLGEKNKQTIDHPSTSITVTDTWSVLLHPRAAGSSHANSLQIRIKLSVRSIVQPLYTKPSTEATANIILLEFLSAIGAII